MKAIRQLLERTPPAKTSLFIMMFALICLSMPKNSSAEVCRQGELGYSTDIRVWLDDEEDVYPCEDNLVFYVRAATDCYATVYVIDTEGFVHVIYPSDPWEHAFVRGGIVYRFAPQPGDIFYSSYPKGIAFIFAVSSPVPFVYSEFGSGVFDGGCSYRIYGDPFIACKRFYLSLLPVRAPLARVSISFSRFYIRTWEPYPRYLSGKRYLYGFNSFDEGFHPAYKRYRRHHNNPYRVLRPEAPLPVRSKDYSNIVKVKSRSLRKSPRGEQAHLGQKTVRVRERISRKYSKPLKREIDPFERGKSSWKKETGKKARSLERRKVRSLESKRVRSFETKRAKSLETKRRLVTRKMTSRPPLKKMASQNKDVIKANPKSRGKSFSKRARKF